MDFSGRSGEMAVFAKVADAGSLSAAARALNLTPSAVSRVSPAPSSAWAPACCCAPPGP